MKITIPLLISLLALTASKSFSAQPIYNPMETKPLDEVLAHFDHLQKSLKNPKARALGLAYQALEAKKTAKARVLATPALANPIFSDYAHWIVGLAYETDAENHDESGKLKPAANPARLAFQHFQSILLETPYSPFFKLVPKKLGETELLWAYGLSPAKESLHLFEAAFERLNRTGDLSLVNPEEVASYAKACKKAPTELCLSWLTHLTEHWTRNSQQFEEVAALFPGIEERSRNPPQASHSTQPYHAVDLDFAAFDDAMLSFTSEKWDDCSSKFQKFLDEFPRSVYRYRARYWLGMALLRQDKKDEAKKIFADLRQDSPLSYYGVLSSIANQDPIDALISTEDPVAAERDVMLNPQESFNLHRAEILLSEKANELAGMELREIKPRPVHSSAFLMYLAGLEYRAQNFSALYGVLTELIQRNYPNVASKTGVEMIFPVLFMNHIKKFSEDRGLDPVLVLSLIKQESAFDTHANSSSGASGLMQLMYFTAIETVPGLSRDDLLEAEQNIMTGTRYLAKLLARFQGNIVLSLAAYNAGPSAVDKWVKEGVRQKLGMFEFIESIPYKETREYVTSIIRNYLWYSKWYSEELQSTSPKSFAYFWKPYGGLNPEVGGPDFTPAPGASPLISPSAVAPQASDSPVSAPPVAPLASPTSSPSSTPSP